MGSGNRLSIVRDISTGSRVMSASIFSAMLPFVSLDGRPSDAGLALIKDLGQIEELEFSGIEVPRGDPRNSPVTDGGLALLEGHRRLSELDLCETNISDGGLVHLGSLVGLRALNLRHTHVSDAGLVHLGALTCLEELDLSATEVSDAGLVHVERLTRLKRLNLSDTRITNAGLERLVALRNLQVLALKNTEVNGAGIVHLKKLTNLKSLSVGGWTSVGDILAQEIKRSMPGVRVDYISINVR